MPPDPPVSICVWCGDVQMVEWDGALRQPTPEELAFVKQTSEYRMAMEVIANFDNPLTYE